MAKKVVARRKSKFNDIYVIQDGGIRELWFKGQRDFFLQTRIDTHNPYSMKMVYSQLMLAALLLRPEPRRILILGLGGALLPNFLRQCYPRARIDVVEIDGLVIEVARKYFYLKESAAYRVHEQDGRVYIKEQCGKIRYDLIMLDAFKSGSVPFHLKTEEFYLELNALLEADGVVASNLYGKSNDLKPHDIRTFKNVFRHIYLFEDPDRIATALLATNQENPVSPKEFKETAARLMPLRDYGVSMQKVARMQRTDLFAGQVSFVFKDNFAESAFLETVEQNNVDGPDPRPYAIINTYVSDPES